MLRHPAIQPLPRVADLGIALWLVDLDSDLGAWNHAVLDAQEQARAARFRFEVHARHHRRSHVALRLILGALTGRDPASLEFTTGGHGKPRLSNVSDLHFNLSHSGAWALVGTCASHPIGVDLEIVKSMHDAPALARSHFTAQEQAFFTNTPAEQQPRAFLRGWTRKEACLKALGSGLSIEPQVFEAGLETHPRDTSIPVGGQACAMHVRCIHLPVDNLLAAVARLATRADPGL